MNLIRTPKPADQKEALSFLREITKGVKEGKVWIRSAGGGLEHSTCGIEVEFAISDNYHINWK